MTEEGMKWALKTAGKKWPEPGIPEQADYWLRALFEKIEKESRCAYCIESHDHEIGIAFKHVKKELLG